MNFQPFRQLVALICCALFTQLFYAQPSQELHAYNGGATTGKYADVVALRIPGPNGEEVAAVGTTDDNPKRGLISFSGNNGIPVSFLEVTSPTSDKLKAEAICQTPNGDVIAVFFDSDNDCSHIYRLTSSGFLMWRRQLNDIHVKDVVSGTHASGMEAIYCAGQSITNQRIAIEGLNAFGAGMMAFEYDLNGAFDASIANELRFNPITQRITVVGTGTIDDPGRKDMIILRTNSFGGFIWARSYFDSEPPMADIEGVSIVSAVGSPNRSTVAFEFVEGTMRSPGAMEVSSFGVRNWAWLYSGLSGTFFDGNEFRIGGIDRDNSTYRISGSFESSTTPAGQRSAYSLGLLAGGDASRWDEYETLAGDVSTGCQLMDLDFDPANGLYLMVGEYNTTGTHAGTWPHDSNPQGFWFVSTNSAGDGLCSTTETPSSVQITPGEEVENSNRFILPTPLNSETELENVTPIRNNQCAFGKRFTEEEALETGEPIEFKYAMDLAQLTLEIPMDQNGTGTVKLIDVQGQEQWSGTMKVGQNQYDLSRLPRGVYVVVYEFPGLMPGTRKILKL